MDDKQVTSSENELVAEVNTQNEQVPNRAPIKHTKKWLKPLAILACVALIIVAVRVIVSSRKDTEMKSSETAAQNYTSSAAPEDDETSSKATESNKFDSVSLVFDDFATRNKATATKNEEVSDSNNGVVVYGSEIDQYVMLPSIEGLAGYFSVVGGSAASEELMNDLAKNLNNNGFSNYVLDKSYYELSSTMQVNVLGKEGIVCLLRREDVQSSPAFMSYNCSDITKTNEVVSKMKPFYEAYATAEPAYVADTLLTITKIYDSVTPGFEIAVGGIGSVPEGGGAGSTYYRKTGGTWVFALGTQAMPSCKEFTTQDMRRALIDSYCYENEVETTVGEAYNL